MNQESKTTLDRGADEADLTALRTLAHRSRVFYFKFMLTSFEKIDARDSISEWERILIAALTGNKPDVSFDTDRFERENSRERLACEFDNLVANDPSILF